MSLYKLEASNWEAFLGLEEGPKESKILTSNINSQLKIELKGIEDEEAI